LCNQVVGSVTVRVDIVVADGDLEGLGQDEIRCSPRVNRYPGVERIVLLQ